MSKSIPLVLDVDGTLIRNDLTHELFLKGVSLHPLKIFTFLYLALTSKPKLKALLIDLVGKDISAVDLPYNQAVTSRAEAAKADGREIILCSGSQEQLIKQIERNFDWLDDSFGTTPTHNLTSKNKAAFLTSRYPGGFDYFGNSTQDYEVWKTARKGLAISPPRATYKIRSLTGDPIEVVEPRRSQLGAAIKALRLHQWSKNILIFLVPTLVVERLTILDIPNLILGFIAMGLLVSGTYIFNDLLDIQADRQHHSKRERPFASGRLSIPTGAIIMAICLGNALFISLALPTLFGLTLLIYFMGAVIYSTRLKKMSIPNIIIFAFLFIIPILAGAAIIDEKIFIN